MIYEDLDSLFDVVFNHDRTFVFGDLGRLPHVVVEYLSSKRSLLKVLFACPYYSIPVPNDKLIRQVSLSEAAREKCDLLILAEFAAHSTAPTDAYRNAARVVVLSSHVLYSLEKHPDLVYAAYFHGSAAVGGEGVGDAFSSAIERTRALSSLQDGFEENGDVRMVRNHVRHPSIVTVGPAKDCDRVVVPGKSAPLESGSHFVVVDLSLVRSPQAAFLYFWDAFDYMSANLDRVDRWSVCFCEAGKRPHDVLVQDCVDGLFCHAQFRPWLGRLLPMLPFYRSGTVDRRFDVPVSTFVRHGYVAPDSLRGAFEAAVVHDLRPLAGGVFSVLGEGVHK